MRILRRRASRLFRRRAFGRRKSVEVTLADPALLIYTSGTTGLPKAAYVSHHRVMMWTHWFAGMMQAGAERQALQLPAHVSFGGRRGGVGRGAAEGRRGHPAREILRPRFLGRCRRKRRHHLPVYRRTLPLSSEAARRARHAQLAAGLRQRPVGRCVGGVPGALSHSAGSWNSMPPPKAISRSTMPKESRARSAAFRPSCGIASASP